METIKHQDLEITQKRASATLDTIKTRVKPSTDKIPTADGGENEIHILDLEEIVAQVILKLEDIEEMQLRYLYNLGVQATSQDAKLELDEVLQKQSKMMSFLESSNTGLQVNINREESKESNLETINKEYAESLKETFSAEEIEVLRKEQMERATKLFSESLIKKIASLKDKDARAKTILDLLSEQTAFMNIDDLIEKVTEIAQQAPQPISSETLVDNLPEKELQERAVLVKKVEILIAGRISLFVSELVAMQEQNEPKDKQVAYSQQVIADLQTELAHAGEQKDISGEKLRLLGITKYNGELLTKKINQVLDELDSSYDDNREIGMLPEHITATDYLINPVVYKKIAILLQQILTESELNEPVYNLETNFEQVVASGFEGMIDSLSEVHNIEEADNVFQNEINRLVTNLTTPVIEAMVQDNIVKTIDFTTADFNIQDFTQARRVIDFLNNSQAGLKEYLQEQLKNGTDLQLSTSEYITWLRTRVSSIQELAVNIENPGELADETLENLKWAQGIMEHSEETTSKEVEIAFEQIQFPGKYELLVESAVQISLFEDLLGDIARGPDKINIEAITVLFDSLNRIFNDLITNIPVMPEELLTNINKLVERVGLLKDKSQEKGGLNKNHIKSLMFNLGLLKTSFRKNNEQLSVFNGIKEQIRDSLGDKMAFLDLMGKFSLQEIGALVVPEDWPQPVVSDFYQMVEFSLLNADQAARSAMEISPSFGDSIKAIIKERGIDFNNSDWGAMYPQAVLDNPGNQKLMESFSVVQDIQTEDAEQYARGSRLYNAVLDGNKKRKQYTQVEQAQAKLNNKYNATLNESGEIIDLNIDVPSFDYEKVKLFISEYELDSASLSEMVKLLENFSNNQPTGLKELVDLYAAPEIDEMISYVVGVLKAHNIEVAPELPQDSNELNEDNFNEYIKALSTNLKRATEILKQYLDILQAQDAIKAKGNEIPEKLNAYLSLSAKNEFVTGMHEAEIEGQPMTPKSIIESLGRSVKKGDDFSFETEGLVLDILQYHGYDPDTLSTLSSKEKFKEVVDVLSDYLSNQDFVIYIQKRVLTKLDKVTAKFLQSPQGLDFVSHLEQLFFNRGFSDVSLVNLTPKQLKATINERLIDIVKAPITEVEIVSQQAFANLRKVFLKDISDLDVSKPEGKKRQEELEKLFKKITDNFPEINVPEEGNIEAQFKVVLKYVETADFSKAMNIFTEVVNNIEDSANLKNLHKLKSVFKEIETIIKNLGVKSFDITDLSVSETLEAILQATEKLHQVGLGKEELSDSILSLSDRSIALISNTDMSSLSYTPGLMRTVNVDVMQEITQFNKIKDTLEQDVLEELNIDLENIVKPLLNFQKELLRYLTVVEEGDTVEIQKYLVGFLESSLESMGNTDLLSVLASLKIVEPNIKDTPESAVMMRDLIKKEFSITQVKELTSEFLVQDQAVLVKVVAPILQKIGIHYLKLHQLRTAENLMEVHGE